MQSVRRNLTLTVAGVMIAIGPGNTDWLGAAEPAGAPTAVPATEKPKESAEWKSLFDGKSLAGWKITQFGGEGEVVVEDGSLVMGFGSPLTGVTFENEFPKVDYEIELEAKRIEGNDFFCGLTFPVLDSHCSLILGGWGGALVGISSLDGMDASENETQKFMNFKKDQWYTIRVRVTKEAIMAWIDKEQIVNVALEGRKISTRPEVDLSKPLGIATYQTRAAIRKVRYRR
jgi:hypothetical protein